MIKLGGIGKIAKTQIAFDVLINWFKNNGVFKRKDNEKSISNTTNRQAEVRARQELVGLLQYYKNNDKKILEDFLKSSNIGLT